MAQTNLSTQQNQTHRHGEQSCVYRGGKGERVGWTGSLGLVDADYDLENGYAMRSCCTARGTLSSLLG